MKTKYLSSNNPALRIEAAGSFWSRFCGLMGRKGLKQGEGLLLSPCNAVHTLFMRFTLDIVFLDKNNVIVALQENCLPWRLFPPVKGAAAVLELAAGEVKRLKICIGLRLFLN